MKQQESAFRQYMICGDFLRDYWETRR